MHLGISSKFLLPLVLIISIISLYPGRSYAQQETPVLKAQVVQISGQVFYLAAGQNQGLSSGDTLTVVENEHGGSVRGELIVIASSSSNSSVRFLNKPFPITRGEELFLKTGMVRKPAITEITSNAPDTTQRTSILNKSPSARPVNTGSVIKPLVSGRIMAGSYLNYSQSRWSGLDSVWHKQNYTSPYLNMILNAARLPGNIEVNVNMRWSYRYMNARPISPANLFSIYQLQISKHWDKIPLTMSIGRFYNRYEEYSGFYDGIMLRYGSYDNGIGVITGFEPSQSSSGFSSTIPKHSIFAYTSQQLGPVQSSSSISFNALYPKNNWLNHIYFGASQEFYIGRNSLGGSLQLDRSPLNSHWIISEGYLHANIQIAGGVSINGLLRKNYPYRLWLVSNPFGFLQTQYGGGLSFNFANGYISGNILRDMGTWVSKALNYEFYGSYPIPYININLNTQASYRNGKSNSFLSLGGGLDRSLGSTQLSLQYQFYRTDYLSQRIITNNISTQLNIPLMNKLYLDLQLQYEFGKTLMNKSAYLGLWYSF